jgi:hypothetical protein
MQSSGDVSYGAGGGLVVLMSVPFVVNGQRCELVRSGWKEMSKGDAVGSD